MGSSLRTVAISFFPCSRQQAPCNRRRSKVWQIYPLLSRTSFLFLFLHSQLHFGLLDHFKEMDFATLFWKKGRSRMLRSAEWYKKMG